LLAPNRSFAPAITDAATSVGSVNDVIVEQKRSVDTACLNVEGLKSIEDEQDRLSDPFLFESQGKRLSLFKNFGVTISGQAVTGKIYAVLPLDTIKQLENAPEHALTVASHVLNASEKKAYQEFFNSVQSSSQVPFYFGAA
jgi:hypothetical protein